MAREKKPRRKHLSFLINEARFQILAKFCKNRQQIQNLHSLTFQKMCTLIKIGRISWELRSVKDGHPCFVLRILKQNLLRQQDQHSNAALSLENPFYSFSLRSKGKNTLERY